MNIPTKHCSQCGTSAASAALFCAQCGSQFAPPAPEPSSYVCEECDTVLPGGSRFCPGCGMAFDTPVPISEPQPPSPGFRPQTSQPNPIPVTLHQPQPVPVSVQLKMPLFSHASGRKVNYGWFSEAFQLFKSNAGVWIGATLIQFAFWLLSAYPVARTRYISTTEAFGEEHTTSPLILMIWWIFITIPALIMYWRLDTATYRMANKQARGMKLGFSDIWSGGSSVWSIFWLSVLIIIATYLGIWVFVVPGLLVLALASPAYALVADGAKISEALGRSVNAMKHDWLNAIVVVILTWLLLLASGLPFGLGLLITFPMYKLLVALACRDMIGLPSVPDVSPVVSQSFASSPVADPPAIGESQPLTFSKRPVLSEITASKTYTVVAGSVLAAAFLALGFGLIRSAHPQSNMSNAESLTSTASLGSTPANAVTPASVAPANAPSASEPPAVQDDDK